jgi:RimJ/RimL family protein N-acetyltransferase
MVDARNFAVAETLKNGVAVTIRAVRPDDKARVVAAFQQLDPESIYTRFFQAKASLSDRELQAATEVDFEQVVALVATVSVAGAERIIGGGRYVVLDPAGVPLRAEIAFLVEEDFHGQGLAGRVLKQLALIGRQKGVGQFEAEVLPQNKAMLAVFARSGLPMKRTSAEGVMHVTLSLADPPQPA